LGNAWLDLNHGSQITPYVSGGLGIGWANVNATYNSGLPFSDKLGSSGLAFQIGAGVRFNVNHRVSIDAAYRFKDIVGLNYATNVDGGDTLTDTSLASHNFQIRLTLQF
jgi:opacity protein-like surface antigen